MFKFRSRPPSSLSDVYATCLSSYALGYPLWFPEPHDTGMPQIGDVGYVDEGAFRRLFNINTAEDAHKVDFWKPPFDIADPLNSEVFRTEKRNPMLPGRYRSHGVRDMDIEALLSLYVALSCISLSLFTFHRDASPAPVSVGAGASYTRNVDVGALLNLGSPASSEKVYALTPLKKYMLRHYDSWVTYVKETLGHDMEKEKLALIVGWVKTKADWTTAPFSNVHANTKVSLGAQAMNIALVEGHVSHTMSVTGLQMRREGNLYKKMPSNTVLSNQDMPSPATSMPSPVVPTPSPAISTSSSVTALSSSAIAAAASDANQCIFLMRLKVWRRLGIVRQAVAGAGYHQLPKQDDERGAAGGGGVVVDEDVEENVWLDVKTEVSANPSSVLGIANISLHQKFVDPLDVLMEYILEASLLQSSPLLWKC